jgi:DNA ligase-associated metallophosphoesterase
MSELRNVADAEITLLDERLILLPERAVYWPGRQALLVADAHFGKAASFRAQGVPVPRGTTTDNLDRLDAMLGRYPVKQIIFLGDFLHHKKGRADATLAALVAWRAKRPELDLLLVRGNHDGHAGDPPKELRVKAVAEPYRLDPFVLCHEPSEAKRGFALAGHLHPAIVLRGRADERLRLPCFWFAPDYAVLPAFGSFTGSYLIQRQPGDQVFVVADEHVLPV